MAVAVVEGSPPWGDVTRIEVPVEQIEADSVLHSLSGLEEYVGMWSGPIYTTSVSSLFRVWSVSFKYQGSSIPFFTSAFKADPYRIEHLRPGQRKTELDACILTVIVGHRGMFPCRVNPGGHSIGGGSGPG